MASRELLGFLSHMIPHFLGCRFTRRRNQPELIHREPVQACLSRLTFCVFVTRSRPTASLPRLVPSATDQPVSLSVCLSALRGVRSHQLARAVCYRYQCLTHSKTISHSVECSTLQSLGLCTRWSRAAQ